MPKHAMRRVIELTDCINWGLIRYDTEKNDYLVPTERLELSRLSSLPPQDSVSTNSTTTAFS